MQINAFKRQVNATFHLRLPSKCFVVGHSDGSSRMIWRVRSLEVNDMKHFYFSRLIVPTAICLIGLTSFGQQTSTSVDAGGSALASGNTQGNRAQQQSNVNAGAGVQTGTSAAGGAMSASGSADTGATVSMSQVPAELVTRLDSKTAKAGDAVEAKTTKTVKTADGVVIQKGSKLLGTVKQSQAHTKGQSEAMLALNFDRVQLRDGHQMMLRSTIDSVSSASALNASGSVNDDETMSSAPVSTGSTGSARGGLGGGLVGGTGSSLSRAGSDLGKTVHNTGDRVAGTSQGLAGDVNDSVSGTARQSNGLVAHATNLPGVMLSSSAASSTSGVLSATDRNIHLDSGTRMLLSIAANK